MCTRLPIQTIAHPRYATMIGNGWFCTCFAGVRQHQHDDRQKRRGDPNPENVGYTVGREYSAVGGDQHHAEAQRDPQRSENDRVVVHLSREWIQRSGDGKAQGENGVPPVVSPVVLRSKPRARDLSRMCRTGRPGCRQRPRASGARRAGTGRRFLPADAGRAGKRCHRKTRRPQTSAPTGRLGRPSRTDPYTPAPPPMNTRSDAANASSARGIEP